MDRRLTAVRFLLAGGMASLLNWLVRFPLSTVLPFDLAVAAAYAIGMILGFILYRAWVFPGSTLAARWQFARFLSVNGLGFAAVVLVAGVLLRPVSRIGGMSYAQAQAIAHGLAILIGALVNYVGHNMLTFARRPV